MFYFHFIMDDVHSCLLLIHIVFAAGSHNSVVCPKHFSEYRKQHMIIETEAGPTCLGQ